MHADGSAYGSAVHAGAAEIGAMLFGALRRLGFRETETRRALARMRPSVNAGEPLENGTMLSVHP